MTPAARVVVFTDVGDSTALVARVGDAEAARLWSEHDREARALLARHRGLEIDRTDGLFAVFERTSDAVAFALGYQAALAPLGMEARVGIHLGAIALKTNADADVARGAKAIEADGLAKPLGARVMSLARGGQVLVTAAALAEATADRSADAIPKRAADGTADLSAAKSVDAASDATLDSSAGRSPDAAADATVSAAASQSVDATSNATTDALAHSMADATADATAGWTAGQSPNQSTAAATRFGDTTQLVRHGHYRLKGIDEPVELFEIGLRDGTRFVPPADVEKAYRVVAGADGWRPLRDVPHNLPVERDPFIGRTTDLRRLATALEGGHRLVTITGPGGIGKTRFARRYAGAWRGDWPGGVVFCELADARSIEGVLYAVASALGVPVADDEPVRQIGHAIASRGRCLLLLDNFEQLVEHAAATVGAWLELAPDARFVATSRERLHLRGEHLFPLDPLPVAVDAIDLFVARARAQRPDFVIGSDHRDAVAGIVRLLDGMPLAIELAAARVRILSPQQIVERLRDRFALLAGARTASARQATLRAAIDWSWDLLAPWEQAAFAQCATFDGGFTLEAAEAVIDLSAWKESPPTMDVIQALADKSLLRTWIPYAELRVDIDEPMFGMYLSIHEYAADKLAAVDGAEAGARTAVETRHGRWFARYGADDALVSLSRAGGAQRRRALALELDNLIAACERAVDRARGGGAERGASDAAGRASSGAADRDDGATAIAAYRAAWEVLARKGPLGPGVALGERVLALSDLDSRERVAALATLTDALHRTGRVDDARARLDEALALAEGLGDDRWRGRLLAKRGTLHREQGRATEAEAAFVAARDCAQAAHDRPTEGRCESELGHLHRELGRIDEARAQFERALARARADDDRSEEGALLGHLGILENDSARLDVATANLQEALAIARELGDLPMQGLILGHFAHLENERGFVTASREHGQAALAIHRAVGDRRLEARALVRLGWQHGALLLIDESLAAFHAALAIAREVKDRANEGFILGSLGCLYQDEGQLARAREHDEAALAIAQEVGHLRNETYVRGQLGTLAVAESKRDEARAHFERALELARTLGYRRYEGIMLGWTGALRGRDGDFAGGRAAIGAGLEILREVDDRREVCRLLCMLANLEEAAGRREEARAAVEDAAKLLEEIGPPEDPDFVRDIAGLRERLGC